MREIPIQSVEPLWRQAISGAQILFVAFGALVLVPPVASIGSMSCGRLPYAFSDASF